jgi:D-alanyl-D-alanine carboxypeptidase
VTRKVAVALVALTASMIGASDAGAGFRGAELGRALNRIVEAPGGPPGVSVLTQRGKRSVFRSRGFAEVRTRRRPTPDDHMRIASVAKSWNGAVALSLVSERRLRLGDTIGRRLPGLLPLADEVTLAQALQHVGGLPDYIMDPDFLELVRGDPKRYFAPWEIAAFVRDNPLRFRPGSRYEYSDTDNIVAGLMAEAATGWRYERLLAREIYRPLRLRHTSLPRTVRMPEPYFHGYDVEPGQAPEDVSEVVNPAGAWASGGIVTTPEELGRFMRAYVVGRLFDGRTRRRQLRFRAGESQPAGPGRNSAGLGIFRYRTRCGTMYGAAGSFPGYRAFAASSPKGRRSVVFSVNAQILDVPGEQEVSDLIRRAQLVAICRALR